MINLNTKFETFPIDQASALCFAQNGKGEESEEVRLFFTWAHNVGKEPQTTEVENF